jgi:membrane fusion protein (multidrug efflux system)
MKIKNYLLIAAAALLAVACGQKGQMPTDNEYPVRTVEASSADMQTTYPATIKGIQDVEIRPKVSGFITKLCVHEGQSVSAGQLLFVIDNSTYQAAVRQAQAAVNSARSQMNTAKLTFENNKKLFASNVIGQYELQSAQDTYVTAQASVSQAKASLASAKEMLSFCYVKSPANGVIGTLPFKVGALVSASSAQPLTTVSNISTVEAYFSMTEKDILDLTKEDGNLAAAIKRFPYVKFQLADGTMYNHPGRIVKVSGVIDATTGTVQMIADFSNPDRMIKSGAAGNIIIPHNASNAIIIPQSSTTEVQNKIFVYVVGKDSKVKYTEITVDPQNDGENYVVTSGLHVGDRYVSQGLSSLSDGMLIKPLTEDQYAKKLQKVEKMGAAQGSLKDFKKAMTGK